MEFSTIQLIAQSFRESNSLVSHHIESYETYLRCRIPEMIYELNPIQIISKDKSIIHIFHLSNVWYDKPVMVTSSGYLKHILPLEAISMDVTRFSIASVLLAPIGI